MNRTTFPGKVASAKLASALASGALLAMVASGAQAAPDQPAPVLANTILLAQAATPAPSTGMPAATSTKTRNPDQKFADNAATGDMAEIQAGKLAQSMASAPAVKTFAEHMVTDHTKASTQMKQIATTKALTLPMEPDRSHARQIEKLGKLKGAEFDREYMKMMVADHKKMVSLFEKEAKNGKDAELQKFAATMVPDLQKHLEMAKATEAEVKKGPAK